MTKFIACEDGSYVNLSIVECIAVQSNIDIDGSLKSPEHKSSINIFTKHMCKILCSNFSNDEKAQEWLDKFMEKHGLCVEPITQTRCF